MRWIFILLVICSPMAVSAQETPTPVSPVVKEMARPSKTAFQGAVLDAIKQARKNGQMTGRQALRLRVAMLSPSFAERAEDLAVTQMAFAGTDEPLPRTTDGKIDRASIDWKTLLTFLEKLLPFLLELLDLFAANETQVAGGVA